MNIIKKLMLLSWTVVALLVFFSALKVQVVIDGDLKRIIYKVFPEGWSFFTKNPRSVVLTAYIIKGDSLEPINMRNMSFEYFFGISRKPRVIGYELSTIANSISKNSWRTNESNSLDEIIASCPIDIKTKQYFKHFRSGEYLLKMYKPIPYAWSEKSQEANNPFSVVKINLKDYD